MDNKKSNKKRNVETGLKDEWTRATFIVKKDHLEKVKALAYWERKLVKEVVNEAFETFLKKKRIKQIP